MYLNPQIHDTQDTLTIHVGYIGIHSRIRISSPTCGRAWMRAGTNLRYMYLIMYLGCIPHVSWLPLQIHVSRMYPACILHLRYVPLRIHLRYTYPKMYLGSIPHVSLMYPRTTADTFIPHVSLINLACIMYVSCMYPRTSADYMIPHVSRMYLECIFYVSWLYLEVSSWRVQDTCIVILYLGVSWCIVMKSPRYMYPDVSWYVSRVTSRKRIGYMYPDVSYVYPSCILNSFQIRVKYMQNVKIHVFSWNVTAHVRYVWDTSGYIRIRVSFRIHARYIRIRIR